MKRYASHKGWAKPLLLPASAILLFSFSVSTFGETKRKLSDEACDYEFQFDAAESEFLIKQTFRFLAFGIRDVLGPQIFAPKDLSKIDISQYDAKCAAQIAEVTYALTLPLNGMRDLKRALADELDDMCKFEKAKMLGFSDPSALLRFESAAECRPFVDALMGKTDIAAAYDRLAHSQCSRNASVDQCLAKWRTEGQDPQWMKINILLFGWSNCATKFLKVNTEHNDGKREKLMQEFKRKYRSKTLSCEQVD
jgi:hypothetical protein